MSITGKLFRRFLVVVITLVAGCAVPPKPYEPPVDIRLQDPPQDQAIVYLLRALYDGIEIAVHVGADRVAILPPSTYTAIVLKPGPHVLTTRTSSLFGEGAFLAPPFNLQLKANERRFLNISGITRKEAQFTGVIPMPGGTMMPIVTATQATAAASRTWKEVTELDAQGLMSIAKLVMPEKGAL